MYLVRKIFGWLGFRFNRRFWWKGVLVGLGVAAFFGVQGVAGWWGMGSLPVVAQVPGEGMSPEVLVREARDLYRVGQFGEALTRLQAAAEAFAARGDVLGQGMALDLQGQVYLAQGQAEVAVEQFAAAAALYERGGDETAAIKSRINQAQALRKAGLYRRALETLEEVNEALQEQADTLLKAIALRSLGITQRLIGNLDEAQKSVEQSLAIAQAQNSPTDISAAYLVLGNIAKDRGNTAQDRKEIDVAGRSFQDAIYSYRTAAETATTPVAQIEAQLNELSILGDVGQSFTDEDRALLNQIRETIDQLPLSSTAVSARINWARMVMTPENQANVSPDDIAGQLIMAVQQARTLKDPRSESYALGQLGELRYQQGQLEQAQENTKQALILAQSIGAADIAYRWQWQLAQILKEQGQTTGAIAAYDAAVKNLESLRSDLVAVNPDVQFSFRESVEPVYREFVGLLLESDGAGAKPENLEKARVMIESLQQAELVNFFRENCLTAKPTKIDEIDTKAAVIYPIVLNDRLEVIVTLPNSEARHYTQSLSQQVVEDIIAKLRQGAISSRATVRIEGGDTITKPEEYLPLAQEVYNWLIRPIEKDLANSGVKTLVFVLDGPLLNLPMAVLHDGQEYLIQKYAIAYTPGLQLLDPKPLARGELTALKAGMSEAPQPFSDLPYVKEELENIEAEVPGELILNEEFTTAAIARAIDAAPFPVVHLATHGQFSSDPENTFILTWDDRLNIDQLNQVLRGREEGGRRALEMLVLSACETATGDKRAALGLAGIAVRAGARSTLATLWQVNDQATAELMIRFYQLLKEDTTITKAEALRLAQLSLLEGNYKEPFFWAPFVLVGNWL